MEKGIGISYHRGVCRGPGKVRASLRPDGHYEPAPMFLPPDGKPLLAYHNGSWHSLFGGTSDLMAGHFINKAADAVGMPSLAQSPPVMIVNRQLYTWMKEGNLAFLMLHRHECYRNHHVLCNGVITVTNHKGENHRYYQIMDGWAHRPRYVDERSVKGDLFWKIPQP